MKTKKELFPDLVPTQEQLIYTERAPLIKALAKQKNADVDFDIPYIFTDGSAPEVIQNILTSTALIPKKDFESKSLAENYLMRLELIKRNVAGKLLPIFHVLSKSLDVNDLHFLEKLLTISIETGVEINKYNENVENITSLYEHKQSKRSQRKGPEAKEQKKLPEKKLVGDIVTKMLEENLYHDRTLNTKASAIRTFFMSQRTSVILSTKEIETHIKLIMKELNVGIKRGRKSHEIDDINFWISKHFKESFQSYFL
jgi:hypothetical protein